MLRKKRPLKGFTSLGGTKRQYRTPDGKIISRRQYENIRAQRRGFKNWHEVQQGSRHSRSHGDIGGRVDAEDYARWLKKAEKETGQSRRQLTRSDSEFNRLLAKAADDDWEHEAGGTFDDFLQFIGVRDEGADYDIGETNAK